MLIRVIAQNTTSGNPRRGWVLVDQKGNFRTFIDEGYYGSEPIEEYKKIGETETISLNITPKQYNELVKRERTCQ